MLFFFCVCDLGSEGVEYGHVVRHLDELLLHVAEDGQGVAEQHLQLTQCRAKTKKVHRYQLATENAVSSISL